MHDKQTPFDKIRKEAHPEVFIAQLIEENIKFPWIKGKYIDHDLRYVRQACFALVESLYEDDKFVSKPGTVYEVGVMSVLAHLCVICNKVTNSSLAPRTLLDLFHTEKGELVGKEVDFNISDFSFDYAQFGRKITAMITQSQDLYVIPSVGATYDAVVARTILASFHSLKTWKRSN